MQHIQSGRGFWVILVGSILGLLALGALSVNTAYQQLLEERKQAAAHVTQAAVSLVDHYAEQVEDGTVEEAEARERAMDAVRHLRFNEYPEGEREYVWITDLTPKTIMHPVQPDLEGRDMTDFVDADGHRFAAEFAEIAREEGAGFVTYQWPRPGEDEPTTKVSYVELHETWEWVIGSGVYLAEVHRGVLAMAVDFLWQAGLVLIGIIGLVTLYFRRYQRQLEAHLVARGKDEEYRRRLLESLAEGVLGIDAEGRYTFLNPVACRLLGFDSEAEALGRPSHTTNHHTRPDGSDYPEDQCPIYRIRATGEALEAWEDQFWRTDGTAFPVQVYAAPLHEPDGTITGVVVSFQDITERRALEDRLRETELRFRQLAESIDDVFWIRTADRILYVNPAYENLWGRSIEELYRDPNAFLEAVHPDDRARVEALFRNELAGDGHFDASYRIVRPDGSIRWIHARSYSIPGDEGEEPRSAGTAVDITEIKNFEEELARSNAELEQFAYAVSHDLQAPLRIVVSYLELLQTRYGDVLEERARRYIHTAVDAGTRMHQMITDLLAYSRVRRYGEPLAPVALGDVVAEARENLASDIQESGASIDVAELPTIQGDHSQLVRLFQNLLGNAIKYGPREGHPVIAITAQEEADGWRILVADNGLGIDPENAERVFQVFQRLHTREEYEGTGAGLALSKRIVERHGGAIGVESAGEGHGSTFWFTLPFSTDPVDNPVEKPV